jgi:hypothetical protein
VLAQQRRAEGMKGLHGDAAGNVRVEQRGQPLGHLCRRLVGEGDGQHRFRRGQPAGDQVGDAHGEGARLARARPGDDHQRAVGAGDGGALVVVEGGEEGRELRGANCEGRGANCEGRVAALSGVKLNRSAWRGGRGF